MIPRREVDLSAPCPDPRPAQRAPRRTRYVYSDHGLKRAAQRWHARGRPPHAREWWFAFRVPNRCMADLFRFHLHKGKRVIATRDALALAAQDTIVTVMWVGWDRVDDLRATLLCRAMGLPVPFEALDPRDVKAEDLT